MWKSLKRKKEVRNHKWDWIIKEKILLNIPYLMM